MATEYLPRSLLPSRQLRHLAAATHPVRPAGGAAQAHYSWYRNVSTIVNPTHMMKVSGTPTRTKSEKV